MSKKPKKETELSPYVNKHWKRKGYCVHGEVSIFGRSTFVDHVAHTGPCHDPDHVIGIEMKRGAGKSLRKQIFKLDVKHVADELWGVVISNPRKNTLKEWKDNGRWNRPGLLIWEDGELKKLVDPKENREYKRAMKRSKLLMVPENKGVIAGYSSGHEDNDYLTHFSYTKDAILDAIETKGKADVETIWSQLPPCVQSYKRPKRAMKRMIRVLEEDEKEIIMCDREDNLKFYKIREEDDDHYDVDDRFEDYFEIED